MVLFKKLLLQCCLKTRHVKVHIFWEGHKILRNLHQLFVLCTASQIEILQNFVALSEYMNFNKTKTIVSCFEIYFDKVAEFMTLNDSIKDNWLIMSLSNICMTYVCQISRCNNSFLRFNDRKWKIFRRANRFLFLLKIVHVFTEKI